MEAEPWLAFHFCPGVPPRTRRLLLKRYGDAATLIKAPPPELRAAGLGGRALQALVRPDAAVMRRSLEWLEGDGAHLIPINDPCYPALLREIHDPPTVLFVLGQLHSLKQARIAIVGSRSATPLGRATAADFARALGRSGLCIVSGLAEGIDAAAHQAALDSGACTLGVCAGGLDRIYPRHHQELARRIAQQGALLSENPPGTDLKQWMFPHRNRIISGMSTGVVVVEAASRSGANITARAAADQGREVFAVPGSIYSPTSRGCHALIRNGAKLVEKPEDVLEELPPLLQASGANAGGGQQAPPALEELPLFGGLLLHAPQTIDDLARQTGLGAAEVAAELARLEIQGRVAPLPDGRFQASR
ncbi:DNA-processing protein DprA [Candidatus Foliamicus sp.]